MSNPSPLSDDEREELIAYLDGEVDEQTARALETRLNLDPAARAEAESLRRTWDLLDYLPRPEPSPNFTQRTLTRVSDRESLAALRSKERRSRRWWAAGWVAALVLAGLAGYAASLYFVEPVPREDDLVRELRLIDNLRLYQSVDSIEFLRELDAGGLFPDDSLQDS
jgi:anti-sigma factor RsiW